MKWEYLVKSIKAPVGASNSDERIARTLQELGDANWELVHVSEQGRFTKMILKRPGVEGAKVPLAPVKQTLTRTAVTTGPEQEAPKPSSFKLPVPPLPPAGE